MIRIDTLPKPFALAYPEIYQIEVTNACNFDCPMCPRQLMPRKTGNTFLPLEVVYKLIREDSFAGSYFVELQMAGEPTLHPELLHIIHLIKSTGVKVGLSTHGANLVSALLDLDYITISVDSGHEKEGVQRDGHFFEKVRTFIERTRAMASPPVIDLQIIELEGWQQQYKKITALFKEELSLPYCNLRTVPDCFLTKFHAVDAIPVCKTPCLNPWLSVSIQSNGNVVPCCFSFGDDIILGNVMEESLREIWQGKEIEYLRQQHATGAYNKLCSLCYMRSPALLHMEIYRAFARLEKEVS